MIAAEESRISYSDAAKKIIKASTGKQANGIVLADVLRVFATLKVICGENVEELFRSPEDHQSEFSASHFIFNTTFLCDTIAEILIWNNEKVNRCIEFITYRSRERDELWFRPLVQHKDQIVLLFPLFLYGNIDRFIEHTCD